MLNSEVPLLYLRIVEVSVNGTEGAKVHLVRVELAYGCCCIRLNRCRSSKEVCIGVRPGETASRADHLNEWRRKPEVRDGVQKDEIMRDTVAAADDPSSSIRDPRKTKTRLPVIIPRECSPAKHNAAQRSGTCTPNGRGAGRIQVGEYSVHLGNPTSDFKAQSQVDREVRTNLEVILSKTEHVCKTISADR